MRRIGWIVGLLALVALGYPFATAPQNQIEAQEKKPNDYALRNAQRELSMLDDLYKTSVVLITTHYVDGKDSLAAGSAAKVLFKAMKDKDWHEVRLLDATGDPYNDENTPKEGFEKRAVDKILKGETRYEEVVTEAGKRYLLGATAVPVVLEKCTLCHESYKNVPQGKAIGALGYKLPIQEIGR